MKKFGGWSLKNLFNNISIILKRDQCFKDYPSFPKLYYPYRKKLMLSMTAMSLECKDGLRQYGAWSPTEHFSEIISKLSKTLQRTNSKYCTI